MIDLRVLDPKTDEKLFLKSWKWQFSKPKGWQELNSIWAETKDEYLQKRFDLSQIDIGIFFDNDFSGLITLNETYPTIFEVHFDCDRKADATLLTEAICIARDYVFSKGATQLFVFVAPQNRNIKKIILNVGFIPTHIAIIYGVFRNRVVRWEQYCLASRENTD